MYHSHTKSGFSLVELSIVLVILGLLVGGILGGQSLIRAAELRSITTDYQRFTTAVYAFQEQYTALPGDFTRATRFWGRAPDGGSDQCANPMTDTGDGTQTCNGNGDGRITAYSTSSEMWRFWQHLANAGMIEGRYTGVHGELSNEHAVIGVNIPAGKIAGSGWSARYIQSFATSGGVGNNYYAGPYGNMMIFGAKIASGEHSYPYRPVLQTAEAWNIDSKMDDGRPSTGNILGWRAGGTYAPDCADSPDENIAHYKLEHTGTACALLIRTGF